MSNLNEHTQNLLIFHSSGLDCAFPLESVREIVPMAALSVPPGLPSALAGFLDLRGTAIPIVLLDRLFNLPEQLPGLYTPLIVLRGVLAPIGILVDSVRGILPAASARLVDLPENGTFQGCAMAAMELDGDLIQLLSPAALLQANEDRLLADYGAMSAGAAAPSAGEKLNCVSQDPGYSHLKDRLTAATGLAFSAEREEALRKLISERLSALGMRDCGSYAGLLDDGGRGRAEMEVLISYLTIGETCFFRDQKQFDAIRDIILPDILARNQHSRQLRIWSAGCATGAEPYSLAILLLDEFADRIWGWQVAIDGTDLNRDFLDQAVEGKFRAWALRSLTAEMTRKCFSQDGLVWTIHPRYQQWVSFRQRNLAGSEFSMPLAGGANYDLILCRNVMIYFTSQARHRLVEQLYQSLGYGGWLVLGASEHSLQTYRGFRPVHADGAKLYQKNAPPLGPGALPLGPGEWGLREPEMAPAPAALSRSLPVPPTAAARRPADPFLKSRTGPGAPDLDGLRQLADRGEWQAAAEYGREITGSATN